MDVLEFLGPHGWLRIGCVIVDKAKSPVAAQGYQHLHYAVGGHGFSGQGDGFVAEEHLRAFCKDLIDLADGGTAEPQLPDHPNGGLSAQLRREPNEERISIEGRITRRQYRSLTEAGGLYTWATQFGFWVTSDSLTTVRNVRWVEYFT